MTRSSHPHPTTADAASRVPVAISADLDRSIAIVVCIPSFRRPQHLRSTLQSLVAQTTDRRFAVVVVDNDAARRESVPVASEFLDSGLLAGLSVVEPQQGNCHAINTAFKTARATFPAASSFLMIDDDEIASPHWLERMLTAAEASGADIVGGPVQPVFDDVLKNSLRRHPAFRPAYDVSGPVPMIYGSGNCLITRAVFDRLPDPAFDTRFNFLGGGDTDFFLRCRRAGMAFHWAEDALISETVPEDRTRPGWLARRGLRIGAINYHVEARAARTPAARLKLIARMVAMMPLSVVRGVRLGVREHRLSMALHPPLVAIGSVLAAFGIEPQQYKA